MGIFYCSQGEFVQILQFSFKVESDVYLHQVNKTTSNEREKIRSQLFLLVVFSDCVMFLFSNRLLESDAYGINLLSMIGRP